MVLVPCPPPQGAGDREKRKVNSSYRCYMGAAIFGRRRTFQHRVLRLVGLQPEEMMFACDWLAPQGKSRDEGELGARRLPVRVAAGVWKRLIL